MLRHKKHASAFIAFLMAFALIFTSSGIGSLTFTKADDTQTIYYNGESVTLSEHALYVNQNLASSSGYSYKTLQEAVANAIPGTKDNPTIIYLEPDVYWTDDYTKTEDRDKNDLIWTASSGVRSIISGRAPSPTAVLRANGSTWTASIPKTTRRS